MRGKAALHDGGGRHHARQGGAARGVSGFSRSATQCCTRGERLFTRGERILHAGGSASSRGVSASFTRGERLFTRGERLFTRGERLLHEGGAPPSRGVSAPSRGVSASFTRGERLLHEGGAPPSRGVSASFTRGERLHHAPSVCDFGGRCLASPLETSVTNGAVSPLQRRTASDGSSSARAGRGRSEASSAERRERKARTPRWSGRVEGERLQHAPRRLRLRETEGRIAAETSVTNGAVSDPAATHGASDRLKRPPRHRHERELRGRLAGRVERERLQHAPKRSGAAVRIAAETSVTTGAVSDPVATHGERQLLEREG